VREPQVFLFDEPLSNLDAKLRVTMRLEIRRLHNRLKATSIFVTHDQVEAMTLADQVVVMNAGKIEQVGKPADVYRSPASRFVATFIGAPAMNLFPGTIVSPGEVETPAGSVRYDASRFRATAGQQVEVGIRPEDFRADAGASGGFALVPEMVEELGATRLIHGQAGGVHLVFALPASDVPVGSEPLRLTVEPKAVHLFDPASGLRLTA
jgi:sn-glycerol 3-phosphate transport system ATP-binding protein